MSNQLADSRRHAHWLDRPVGAGRDALAIFKVIDPRSIRLQALTTLAGIGLGASKVDWAALLAEALNYLDYADAARLVPLLAIRLARLFSASDSSWLFRWRTGDQARLLTRTAESENLEV